LITRADNVESYEKTVERVAKIIPHQTYSLDPVLPTPVPRSNCYIEWMLKVGEAASLLKHTDIMDLIGKNARHVEIILAVRTILAIYHAALKAYGLIAHRPPVATVGVVRCQTSAQRHCEAGQRMAERQEESCSEAVCRDYARHYFEEFPEKVER